MKTLLILGLGMFLGTYSSSPKKNFKKPNVEIPKTYFKKSKADTLREKSDEKLINIRLIGEQIRIQQEIIKNMYNANKK